MWRTRITAHSGCEGTPDNSMEYVGLASTLGVDVLEFDVRRSDNGELVMAHDADEIESEQLSEAFEFLVAYPHLRMNCDLKASGLELAVWELACQHKVQQQLVYSGRSTLRFCRSIHG